MARVAKARYGVNVRIGGFDIVSGAAIYDGIWAHYSLLHARRADFPQILRKLHHTLRPRGLMLLAMKTGAGEARDRRERFFTYYTVGELMREIAAAGFELDRHETGSDFGFDGTPHPYVVLHARAGCPLP